MKFQSAAALMLLAVSGVWAQIPAPVGARPLAGRARTVLAPTSDAGKSAEMRSKATMDQRVQEMEATLATMHALLKQMRGSTAVKNSKDPMMKANLEMWGLMIQQLDKQFDHLKVATREREDLDARRAAIYKQAQESAAQAASNAQAQAQAHANLAVTPTSGSEPAAAQTPASSSPK